MPVVRRWSSWLCGLVLVAVAGTATFADPREESTKGREAGKSAPAEREAIKTALAEFNSLIGGWRGVGQPQRNSTKDAWTETADWAWHFDKDTTAIRYLVKDGKLLQSADLSYDPDRKVYTLAAKLADDVSREYEGALTRDGITLESKADADGFVHRVAVTRLNEKRTIVVFDKRKPPQTFYTRVAQVGYTREGTSLAIEGAGEPECVVSGGKGTIRVSFKGETYYVCCTGCQQAFDADPEGTIAEYKLKVAERAKKKPN